MTAPIPRDIPDLPAVPGMPGFLPSAAPATAVMAPVRHPVAAAYRVLVALTAVAAVTVEILLTSPVRALSYFAVQNAIFLTAVLLLSARRAWTARHPLPSALTGATLLYATITALVYHLLLTNTWSPFTLTGAAASPTGWHAVTTHVLHTVIPLATLLDWLLLTPPGRMHLRQAATWLLYPLAYLLFSFTRGALIPPGTGGRYLYPFLDVDLHGYKSVLGNTFLLGLSFSALAILLIALDHARPNPIRHSAKTGFRLQPPVG
ncbi:Pr6Pr family membrane protein [Streptomyces sp. NPDC019531]|uniref:Pr6Pr family membrane protein n=1 Tax=Streptomyces sp. NPDC019531 TaxID=3365062 RepID=UPI00384A6C95